MYDLTLLNKYNFPLTWNEIYAGIDADLLTPESASQYASSLADQGLLPDNMSELLWETNDKLEIKKILKNTLKKLDIENSLTLIKKKLRYVILMNLREREYELSNDELLTQITMVYENFDYPADMEGFIPYLPSNDKLYDPALHSLEDNQKRLIDKFHDFLKQNKLF